MGRCRLAWAAALVMHGAAHGQSLDAPASDGISSLTRRASVSVVATDNDRASGGRGGSGLITTGQAGLSWRRTTGALTGVADYALIGVAYVPDSSDSEFRHALSASARAELVDNRVFVDATGTVQRQLISAFGNRSAETFVQRNNQADVASYSLSPYVRGVLGGAVDYEGRLSYAAAHADRSGISDSSSAAASVRLASVGSQRFLSWSASLVHRSVDFSEGRRVESDSARGVLTAHLDPQVTVSAIGGYEANDFVSLEREGRTTYGAGFTWRPTQRTRLAAEYERRFFGDAHTVTFEHRTRRTAIQLGSSRGTVIEPERLSTRGFGRLFDLFFLQFSSIEPDPVRREQLVNNFLAANGLRPDAVVVNGFLSSGVLLERRQDLSFTLLGVRDTVTFALTRTNSQRLDQAAAVDDDFAQSSFVQQRGYSLNWARRLTPVSSLNMGISRQRSRGSLEGLGIDFDTYGITWSSGVGKTAVLSIGVRHSSFDGEIDPYDENAVSASLGFTF